MELSAIVGGLATLANGIATANATQVVAGSSAALGLPLIRGAAAKALTSPGLVDSAMRLVTHTAPSLVLPKLLVRAVQAHIPGG